MKNIGRIIGEYDSGRKGNLLFITAGIHGNEPAGVLALQKVFKSLQEDQPKINGKVVGVVGNRKALQNEVRFIDEDLNRTWTSENIDGGKNDTQEKMEMFKIIKTLQECSESQFEKRYFLDCHTTSSNSEPYISVQDVNENLNWANSFPTYIIRGFSDIVKGSIDRYFSQIGLTGFTFEAGQHQSEVSVDNHKGIIWLSIKNACDLKFEDLKEYPKSAQMLENKKPNRKIFDIIYRHGLSDEDEFEMMPGFINFQSIQKGDLLAHQNNKPVYSEWDAYIFMPLYQSQGNDGFFVVKEIENKKPSPSIH